MSSASSWEQDPFVSISVFSTMQSNTLKIYLQRKIIPVNKLIEWSNTKKLQCMICRLHMETFNNFKASYLQPFFNGWKKYCLYDVKHYSINQSINQPIFRMKTFRFEKNLLYFDSFTGFFVNWSLLIPKYRNTVPLSTRKNTHVCVYFLTRVNIGDE